MTWNRTKRIALPFFIFMPLIIISVFAIVGWAMNNIEHLSPMMLFFKSFESNPDAAKMPFSTMHLWFIFNLALFCIMAVLLVKINFQNSRVIKLANSPTFAIIALPLLMVPALLTQPIPAPAAERIYPEIWSFGFYGLFFIFGMALI